jgi:hypothetical protein
VGGGRHGGGGLDSDVSQVDRPGVLLTGRCLRSSLSARNHDGCGAAQLVRRALVPGRVSQRPRRGDAPVRSGMYAYAPISDGALDALELGSERFGLITEGIDLVV